MKGKGTYGELKRYFSQECNCGTIIIESEGTITSNTEIPKPDIVLKEFWRKNEHFADLFNAFLFEGQQVLKAGDLEETDTDISGILKRNDLGKAYQKSLDVVKKTAHGVDFVILGLENQEKIHYAMPLRILQGDVMLYLQECKDIQKINGEQNQYSSADEYLSRFKKTDRLHPVITLCVYYGEKDWDGPRCLTDMLKIPEGYRTFVSDYKMNLLEIRKSDQLLFSDPDVENAFRLVRMIYNRQFSEINQLYQNFEMDPEIGLMVGSVTKTPKIAKQAAAIKAEGGMFNMCTAMKELEQELKQEGKREGIREGKREGMILKLISQVMRKAAKGYTPAQTADMLEEDPVLIQRIYDAIEQTAPEHDMEKICDFLAETSKE